MKKPFRLPGHRSKKRAAMQRKAVYKGSAEWAADQRTEEAARMAQLYPGSLQDDMPVLRKRGFGVYHEGNGYRVGNHLCTAEEMRAKAARERRLEGRA